MWEKSICYIYSFICFRKSLKENKIIMVQINNHPHPFCLQAKVCTAVLACKIYNARYTRFWVFILSVLYLDHFKLQSSSVQFSSSVISDSLRPHEPQHARPPCPSPTPGAHPNSCPLSWWCHPAISSSVVPFSSCPQSLPASESFPMS